MATRLQPSPTAGPFTAATIGTRHRTIPVTIWRPCSKVVLPQRAVAGEIVEVAEVAAGREGAPGTGDDRHPRLVVGVQLREERGQPGVQHVVRGVQLVGTVQRDDPDGAVPADRQFGR